MSIIQNVADHVHGRLQSLLGGTARAGDGGSGLLNGGLGGLDGLRGPGGHSPQLHLPGQHGHGNQGASNTGLASPASQPGVDVGPPVPSSVATALGEATAPVSQLLQSVLGGSPQPGVPANPILSPPTGGPQAPFNASTLLAGPAQAAANLPQTVANTAATALGVAQGAPAAAAAGANAVAPPLLAAAPTGVTAPGVFGGPLAAQAASAQALPAGAAVPAAQGNPGALGVPTAVRPGEVPTAPVPGRTDVLPQRADAGALAAGRTIAGNPAATAPPTSTLPSAPATQSAMTAQANTMAVPASQAAAETRGNVVLPGAGNDRAGLPLRPEGQTAIYTLDGLQRKQRRQGVAGGRLDALLQAFGSGALEVRDVREEILRVTQWLYWILAVVAYASLGLALVAFLPVGSGLFEPENRSVVSGTSLVIGLGAAVVAWWLARAFSPALETMTPDAGDDDA